MADRDNYRGYGRPSGRYYEGREYYGPRDGRRDRDEWQGRDRERDDDRGFFERAGEEIRSWFSDDDDRSRYDDRQRQHDRDQGYGWGSMMSGRGGRERDFRQDAREPWGGGDRGQYRSASGGYETGTSRYGGTSGYGRNTDRPRTASQGSYPHDEHYSEWRRQQMDALDRDYDEYRRENRDRFSTEFSSWRGKRHQQRASIRQVRENMDVVGSDGQPVGTVDRVTGDRIVLTRSGPMAGGHHHSIPCSWLETVDDERVTITKTAEQARQQWQDEDNRRALFESDDQRREDGPHILDRSFSGTYDR